ncbi:Hypothetical_protein [Hexamita inflata]|uniref:Hypothetical_protein n=1 Tax=Hexamita inflata TaxID=28002 RepID=A0AA86RCY9_9EUKA|nr:Hypothetical protein HINF_LOCUS57804 [Hexamita inflata]
MEQQSFSVHAGSEVSPIDIHFHQVFTCQITECGIHKICEDRFSTKQQTKPQPIPTPPQKIIDCQQQQELDKPFARWISDNNPGKTPDTIPHIPQAQIIIAPIVVEKQSQVKCKERIITLTKNAKYLTDNTHNEFQFAIFQDMIKTIDPLKPIEGFNSILNQFRLRQCVKQLESRDTLKCVTTTQLQIGEGRATIKKPIHQRDKQVRVTELRGLQLQQWKLLAVLRAAAQEGIKYSSNRPSEA